MERNGILITNMLKHTLMGRVRSKTWVTDFSWHNPINTGLNTKYSKKYLSTEVLAKMYRGLVEPHFSYCCSVWGNCSKRRIDSLQKVQNRAARLIMNSAYQGRRENLWAPGQNAAWALCQMSSERGAPA